MHLQPVMQELVLAGAGQAHLGVLRALSRHPLPPSTRATLVTQEAEAIYSGMLPGLVAGRFAPDECRIDLPRLARAAGVRFLRAEACGLDLRAGLLLCRDRPPVRFDVISLALGATPRLPPGGQGRIVPLRPFDAFLRWWQEFQERIATAPPHPPVLLVAGAGAAGVEIALAIRRRLKKDCEIGVLARGKEPLRRLPLAARHWALRELSEAGITLHREAEVARAEPGILVCADGRRLPCDAAIWAGGAGVLPSWLRDSGLVLCRRGLIATDATLRSVGDARVFATGDGATVLPHPRDRAGVFAVRQGLPLARNLRRVLEGRELHPFRPQRQALALVTTGTGSAIAARGRFALRGGWVLRLKDRIDRRWIRLHAEMPAMPRAAPVRTPHPDAAMAMRCGGCGAKLPSEVLARVLARLQRSAPPDSAVRLGLEAPDDAALLAPPASGRVLVQSVDFFRSFLGDPWLFGRIAATHALGDIAAMGARPRGALAIACLPPAAEVVLEADLFAMLRGGQEVLEAAGAPLMGGHSAEGVEPALGFAVTGEVEPERALRRGGLRPGDVLLLTKPLGTGTLMAATMGRRARARWTEAALAAMQVSPFPAAQVLLDHGARACADVTGFGLIGHLLEMLRASGAAAMLDPFAVPALEGAAETLAEGILSTLHPANAAAAEGQVEGGETLPAWRRLLLLDPQTAGGLLAGLPAGRAAACLRALREQGFAGAAIIGQVTPGMPFIRMQPGAAPGFGRWQPAAERTPCVS